jgi:hypothetical protein
MNTPAIRRFAVTGLALVALAISGAAAAGTPDTPGAQLLRAYQPVTIFDPQEPLRPSKVQPFIRDSVLERFDGSSWVVADPNPGPGSLPGPGSGIWRLNQKPCSPAAFLGGLDCYVAAWGHGTGGDAVYGRVVRSTDSILLQYWYFYYDNMYSYVYPRSDFIWQAHEGDWETVNVVLTAAGEPLSVGYSQHCLGQRREWEALTRRGTHPVVYVALGSHANYFSAGEHAFNPACVPPEAQGLLAQLGLPLPSDRTGDGDSSGPPSGDGAVTPIHGFGGGESGWVQFPGFWGELEYLHAPVVGTVPFGAAPLGPAFKPIWADPVAAMAAWPQG